MSSRYTVGELMVVVMEFQRVDELGTHRGRCSNQRVKTRLCGETKQSLPCHRHGCGSPQCCDSDSPMVGTKPEFITDNGKEPETCGGYSLASYYMSLGLFIFQFQICGLLSNAPLNQR
ncbi:hypothetical protein Bca4012_030038 [Brassica carinata]